MRSVEGYRFGPFRLDLVERGLYYQGEYLPLSAKTFDILWLLLQNRGQIVTKEDLIKFIWPEHVVEENNLTVRMSGLRKVLGKSTESRFIETVSGRGYRFVGRVHEIYSQGDPLGEDLLYTLAVLPFINESKKEKLNYYCGKISESLITSLSLLSNIRVIGGNSLLGYKEWTIDPIKIGKKLGAQAILIGKVNEKEGSLMIDIEIIDIRLVFRIWGRRYKRRLPRVFDLQEVIARDVMENLRAKLDRELEDQA